MDDPLDEELDDQGPILEGWHEFWNAPLGLGLAFGLVVVASGLLLFGQLDDLGIWEPWEAGDVLVAQEYQDRPAPPSESELGPRESSYNWAVPTRDQQPIERSFLKIWSMAQTIPAEANEGQSFEVGQLEFMARLPMALGLFCIALLGFLWMRRRFETWPALLTTLAFVSTPAIYMGSHNVATEMFFVVTTTGAIFAFVELLYDDGPLQYLWGPLFGVIMGLAFLDQRFLGLALPLTVIVGFALTQLPFERVARAEKQVQDDTPLFGWPQLGGGLVSIAAAIGVVAWAVVRSSNASSDQWLLPHVEQIVAVSVPALLWLAGLALAWKTRVVRRLRSPAGLLGLAIATGIVVWHLEAYANANPTLIKDGHVVGQIPVLTYALENHVFGDGFPNDHMYFALWVRELGFSMIPWAALAPLGVGYLARSTRLSDRSGTLREDVLSERDSTKRLLLVWAFAGVAVVGIGSLYGHFFIPTYFPLLAGVGLMFSDEDFWQWARRETLLPYFMGFAAIAIVLMLTKDLSRWPARLIETYMMFQRELGLPDAFGYGTTLDVLKYLWIGLVLLYFFGLLSTCLLTIGRIAEWPGRIADAAGVVRDSIADVLARWRGGSSSRPDMTYDTATADDMSPARRRALEKESLRHGSGPISWLTRLVETPLSFGAIVTGAFVATAGVFLFQVAPELGNHLSQRNVFETYTERADEGEPLLRYRVDTRDTSVYLRNVESIPSTNAFVRRYQQDQRFFAVIPRDQLSMLNKRIRTRMARDEHIPVLDARSSKLLLVSNQLEEGEENRNFVEEAVVEGEPDIDHQVTFQHEGQTRHPVFDGRLKLIGYSLDKPGTRRSESGDVPTYSWGDAAKLTTYFRVMKSVSGNKKIFLHVDHPGSRIHGDHKPVGGDFPTGDWLPGDVVKDVYHLKIDNYASAGIYTMYFGFYRGGDRMKVQPPNAHDGGNRVPMGEIRVTGF